MKCRSKLTLIAAGFLLAASAQALEAKLNQDDLPLLAPEVQHETASKRVTSRFTRSHYKHFNLNDDFSQAIFNRYLEMLDYNRNIFTQADIDSFATSSKQIDDQLKAGNNQIAFDVYNLSMQKRF
ncbi:tail-specific protease, partial [Vibrio sp. 10N.261.48.A2]